MRIIWFEIAQATVVRFMADQAGMIAVNRAAEALADDPASSQPSRPWHRTENISLALQKASVVSPKQRPCGTCAHQRPFGQKILIYRTAGGDGELDAASRRPERAYGVPIAAAAIRFVLRHPAVTAVVVGARHAAEVIEDVGHLTAAVPAELFDELAAEHLVDGTRPGGVRRFPAGS